MKSTFGSWSSVITERVTNPIIASYLISWSLYNWKFWVLLFSRNTASETFKMISAMYDDMIFGHAIPAEWAVHGFGVPLILAAIYLAFMPPLTGWYYKKVRRTHDEVEKAKGEFHKWLSPEETHELRARRNELDAEVEAQQLVIAVGADRKLSHF